MTWQDWSVAAIAVVVAIVLVRRVWRFVVCGDTSSTCEGCNKECSHRKKR
ncbi:MAG: hypothetical protein IKU96_01090 [Alistipes sp.]|nr:hypothetical protein [Alistipes sp.]